jgi:hypothetical protein
LKGIGVPEYYLGGNFHQVGAGEKGIKTALSATTYITNTVEKFERMFGGMIKESKFPMIEGSQSTLLSSKMATQYRAVIGSLNWVVNTGTL